MDKVDYLSHNWLAVKNNNKWVEKYLPNFSGRLIDLGCGIAPYKEEISKVSDEYIGVDWINSVHNLQQVDVVANLNSRLPFADEQADVIISLKVLEHLYAPTIFLSECFRVLRPDGKLFLLIPFLWQVHEAPYDYCRYTRYGLSHLLTQAGFTEIEISEKTGFWEMWILKFNYHSLKFARGIRKYIWIPIWWLVQSMAPIMDKYDWHPEMTASYAVFAQKVSR